jgi:C-terminal processing protease CtpA/Prc
LCVGFRDHPPRPAVQACFDEVFGFAKENPVERMVIDLRQNAGGDFTKTRELPLPRLE